MAERTEISFEVSPDEVAVLDGYCSAKNIKRTTVFRQLLKDWSAEQLHVATLILATSRKLPDQTGVIRNEINPPDLPMHSPALCFAGAVG